MRLMQLGFQYEQAGRFQVLNKMRTNQLRRFLSQDNIQLVHQFNQPNSSMRLINPSNRFYVMIIIFKTFNHINNQIKFRLGFAWYACG